MNLKDIEFGHKPPKGFRYEVRDFKRNVISIWLCHPNLYTYKSEPIKTIWGFYDTKKKQYLAPKDCKTVGKVVDFADTRNYTAMQLNLNPLERAFL
jgi:hypothetical protein